MITRIEIDGFKTFTKFQMEFAPLTIIAGTNASGKSNLFDAMQLLSRIVDIDLKTALVNREEMRVNYLLSMKMILPLMKCHLLLNYY